ncbi:hypothetical protein P175DRAFT_0530287 [Aspergillus ochraceoroseus IBT 24754]|uniref:Trafficking PGA2 n=3 Tax=Aspergillus subgen. Nidulantes TaxID=2720870 RepID=A0A0F8VPT5_9EURO|nr:uncharacterized protein P175DRAFT_0530287 [Aspergillus ochraceoroseus IBT 24754]KKK17192.1 hypothetical protein AOCH_005326 [Aspergillus ochraceoroseus]KKK25196.1 hypothetical protein ARAM_001035 [Aspergillus rambellii]PTU23182.1 hypothetical protein P175DRAFT_0530287 [Aspergillus ochraceoroseus IBT 24754]
MVSPDDAAAVISDSLNDFFSQLYTFFETIIRRFCTNFYNSFAEVSVNRWTKVALSVVGYILIRPYIEALFKKMHDRDRKKQQEKERAKAAAAGKKKKAKVSPNALRGAGAAEGGKVLGEVENTDDEIEEDAEEFAAASGVPEWGKNARKRMKKHRKNLERESAERDGEKLSEDQIMELLDWSDSEGEGEKKNQA